MSFYVYTNMNFKQNANYDKLFTDPVLKSFIKCVLVFKMHVFSHYPILTVQNVKSNALIVVAKQYFCIFLNPDLSKDRNFQYP